MFWWIFLVHVTVHCNKFLYNKTHQMHQFPEFTPARDYMFRAVPLSIVRSLFTVHLALVYVIEVWRQLSSRTRMELILVRLKAVFKPVWHIPVPSVQWINSCWWAEELPETCRVSYQSKFEKLVHLVGFIIKKNVLVVFLVLHVYCIQRFIIPVWC